MQIPSLQQLLEAGVHFGHRISRGNPRMKQYIYGVRDGVSIIDLTLSEKGLREACEFAKKLGSENQILMFVGTKKQAQTIVSEAAQKIGAPYLTSRWIGGFLTNFEEINKNIKLLNSRKEQKEKGELAKYTKKEQLLIDRRVAQLQRDLGGVVELTKTPDALFIVDGAREETALREALRTNIKTIAIADTNSDPNMIDYPIPGNDDAIKSIKLMVETIAGAYEEGLKSAKQASDKQEKKVADEKLKEEKKALADASMLATAADIVVPEEEIAAVEEEVEKEELQDSERKVE
jgi:small subunit ribosomal protein S2